MSTEPLKQRSIDDLLQRAAEFEAMAATATMMDTAAALLRLADRCRAIVRQRVGRLAYEAGEPAPLTGLYQQLNIFGTPTGTTATVQQGDPVPPAPRGFSWRLDVRAE